VIWKGTDAFNHQQARRTDRPCMFGSRLARLCLPQRDNRSPRD
jgi:hypothetical protein